MVSVGLRALPLSKHRVDSVTERPLDAEDSYSSIGEKRQKMGRKPFKKHGGGDGNRSVENKSGGRNDENSKAKNFQKEKDTSTTQSSFIRKQVDPETSKYFLEIANVLEGTEIELEERGIICGNALEEARGKEVELANDYIISHTMQILLEGCSVDHLCGFLRSCAKSFSDISMDRSGSHVAETALKSLATNLEDSETYSLVEDTLSTICKEIVANPVDIMCNVHGSHVLRSFLCLCKGASLDSSEFHHTKSSTTLAGRVNSRSYRSEGVDHTRENFPDLLNSLVSGIIRGAGIDLRTIQANQYSSMVLQTCLRLIAGHEGQLLHLVPVLLGCQAENDNYGNWIQMADAQKILRSVEEMAFSRLMEVILEVAPDVLYIELFTKVFRNSLFQMSSHQCANFVVQALISQMRSQDQMSIVWEELGGKFKNLLEMGMHGVVASLVAACQRLNSHESQCSQALSSAVCLENESPRCIVPRILFLDNYFSCEDYLNWNWPNGSRIHVMGSLILQSIFKFPSEFIHAFLSSITSLEDSQVLETSKDQSGARVIEAFLSSNSSTKHKRKLVVKLRGHFGELSFHQSGSFTVEKCFNVSSLSMRETIVSELSSVQPELSKTKHGPYLLRKLDVDGFARYPEQWKSKQASKESVYKEYLADFGSQNTDLSQSGSFLAGPGHKARPENFKEMRKDIDSRLSSASVTPFLAHMKKSGHKRPFEKAEGTKKKSKKAR